MLQPSCVYKQTFLACYIIGAMIRDMCIYDLLDVTGGDVKQRVLMMQLEAPPHFELTTEARKDVTYSKGI